MTTIDQNYQARKTAKADRGNRLGELKRKIQALEFEREEVRSIAPEAQAIAEQWSGHLRSLADGFVHELTARAAQGKTPVIAFDSPGAIAFALREQWLAAIPDLAETVVGRRSIGHMERSAQIASIDSELLRLRTEYASLGGV